MQTRIKQGIAMLNLSEKVPGYLLGAFQVVATVTFISFWALLSLILTVPFSSNVWFKLDMSDNFSATVIFLFVVLAVIISSRRAMYVEYSHRGHHFTYLQYCLWIIAEILVACALYTTFTIEGPKYGLDIPAARGTFKVFLSSLSYGIMALGVPNIFAGMYFTINDRNNTIRVMNYSSVVSDVQIPAGEQKITLFDNNGALKLSVSSANLYYIESDDNYVRVWYCDSDGNLKQYMLRCKLKTIEESFFGTSLIRINRKYIVNMQKVTLLHREREGYEVNLDREEIKPLPVTKTYEASVLARFNETNQKNLQS